MQIAKRDWTDVFVGTRSDCQAYLDRLRYAHPKLADGRAFRYQNRSIIPDDQNYWALQVY